MFVYLSIEIYIIVISDSFNICKAKVYHMLSEISNIHICTEVSPNHLYVFLLNRMYSADIKTEPPSTVNIDQDELPHTYSTVFNPYRESMYGIHILMFTLVSL